MNNLIIFHEPIISHQVIFIDLYSSIQKLYFSLRIFILKLNIFSYVSFNELVSISLQKIVSRVNMSSNDVCI